MTDWKKLGLKLLYPGKWLWILIPPISFALLAAVFYFELPESPLIYGSYVFAFYGLVVLCAGSIPLLRAGHRLLKEREERKPIQIRRSLVRSLSINVCYAGFNLLSGAVYRSAWLISTGIYYLCLSVIRIVLVQYEKRQTQIEDPAEKLRWGWRGFQRCGILMLGLNVTMSGMIVQMIWDGKGSHYPELVVYAVATYTFYRLVTAIIRVIQSKENDDPIDGAARNISLTAAMMSLYSLQTAMLSAFGDDARLQHLMNSLSGGAVCVLVILGALGMVVHGGKRKREVSI